MGQKRGSYTTEFRYEAVRMVLEQKLSAVQVARDLGIKRDTLYGWVKKYRDQIEPASAEALSLEEENRRLRRDVARLRTERDILKKAAAYFANNQK